MPRKEMLSVKDQDLLAQEVYQRLTKVAAAYNPAWTTPLELCTTPPTFQHPMYGLRSFDSLEGPRLRNLVYPDLTHSKWSTGFVPGESKLPTQRAIERIARLGRIKICGALIAARRGRSNNPAAYRALRSRSVPLLRELRTIAADPRLRLSRQKRLGAAAHYRRKAIVTRVQIALEAANLRHQDLSELHNADPSLRAYVQSKMRLQHQACTVWEHLYRYPDFERLPRRSAQTLRAIAISRGLTTATTAEEQDRWLARAGQGEFAEGPRLMIAMGKARKVIHGHAVPGWDLAKGLAELIDLEGRGVKHLSGADQAWLRHAVLYLIGRMAAKLQRDPGISLNCLHDTLYSRLSSLEILSQAYGDADLQGNAVGKIFLRIERAKVIAESRNYDLFDAAFDDLKVADKLNDKLDNKQDQAEHKVSMEAAEAILDRAGTMVSFDQMQITSLIRRAKALGLPNDRNWLIEQTKRQF